MKNQNFNNINQTTIAINSQHFISSNNPLKYVNLDVWYKVNKQASVHVVRVKNNVETPIVHLARIYNIISHTS